MQHSGARSSRWPVWAVAVVIAAVIGVAAAGLPALRSTSAATGGDGATATGAPVPPVRASGSERPEPVPSIGVSPLFALDQYSIDDAASPWVIVNKSRPLSPSDFAPPDLRSLRAMSGGSSQSMRAEAAAALQRMYDAAAAAGTPFAVSTAYRSYSFQSSLYNGYVRDRGRDVADSFSARPGYSEHQTGWSVDVCSKAPCRLTTSFADQPAGRWIDDHLWEYGFVLRYDSGQANVTGYIYEPWHMRYVGTELARFWHEQGRPPLETMFGLPAAPSYD